jgi:hypothetical protein
MNAHYANDSDRPEDAGYASHGHACPRCNGSVYRVPRRFVDLLLSRFMPVRRYRCDSMGCDWEGNLRMKRYSLLIRGPL